MSERSIHGAFGCVGLNGRNAAMAVLTDLDGGGPR